MKKLRIRGGNHLEGEVIISGSKNSALPIICASLLARDKVTLTNCPEIDDLDNLFAILRSLGASVNREGETVVMIVHPSEIRTYPMKQCPFFVPPII